MKIKRLLLGMTLAEMAKKLGITPSHLSSIEGSHKKIPKKRLQEFIDAYGGSL